MEDIDLYGKSEPGIEIHMAQVTADQERPEVFDMKRIRPFGMPRAASSFIRASLFVALWVLASRLLTVVSASSTFVFLAGFWIAVNGIVLIDGVVAARKERSRRAD